MRLRDKEIRGLPVVTTDGEKIGKLAGFVVDTETHAVVQYVVTKSRLLSALLPKELLVHPSQVVSVDDEKMVVKGEFIAVEAAEAIAATGGASAVSNMTRSADN